MYNFAGVNNRAALPLQMRRAARPWDSGFLLWAERRVLCP